MSLNLTEPHLTQLITINHPDAIGIKYGFEGGRIVQSEGKLHLFTSEMVGDPKWVKMRLGHWTSDDGSNWYRIGTVCESSGNYTGTDRRAAL